MTVLCGTQTPRLIHAEDWATEDDWQVFELSQKQRKGIQDTAVTNQTEVNGNSLYPRQQQPRGIDNPTLEAN